MIRASERIRERMYGAYPGIPESDSREVAGHDHLAHFLETAVLPFGSNLFEHIENDVPGGLAENPRVRVRFGRDIGFNRMYQRINSAARIKFERQSSQ